MRRNQNHAFMATATTLVLFLVAIGGCSSDQSNVTPAAPSPAQPQFVTATEVSGPMAVPQGLAGDLVRNLSGDLGKITMLIDGERGGVVQTSRFKLTFPKGSFLGAIPITIIESDRPFVQCQLLPEGLYFNAPVTLEIDLTQTNGDNDNTTVYWLDPMAGPDGSWVDIHGKYNANDHSVKATLQHFSAYAPGEGRAGW